MMHATHHSIHVLITAFSSLIMVMDPTNNAGGQICHLPTKCHLQNIEDLFVLGWSGFKNI